MAPEKRILHGRFRTSTFSAFGCIMSRSMQSFFWTRILFIHFDGRMWIYFWISLLGNEYKRSGPALCLAGQVTDAISCLQAGVPAARIRDSVSWANSFVMYTKSLCLKKKSLFLRDAPRFRPFVPSNSERNDNMERWQYRTLGKESQPAHVIGLY